MNASSRPLAPGDARREGELENTPVVDSRELPARRIDVSNAEADARGGVEGGDDADDEGPESVSSSMASGSKADCDAW